MPIRFTCPHCHQKLTVSSRKVGSAADCPRCKRQLTIPDPPPGPKVVEKSGVASGESTIKSQGSEASGPEPLARSSEPITDHWTLDTGRSPSSSSDPQGFEGLELVYDNCDEPREPQGSSMHGDLIAVPRYVLYLQGGLIAVVALTAFAIGLLAGGTLSPSAAPPAPQACVISGSVTYAAGTRNLPDEGAVVAIVPQAAERPDEKAPIEGLRPGDPTPDAAHPGVAVLRGLGGGYARADAAGQFELRVPDRGTYLVLVVSREKRARSADEMETTDLLRLGPYFKNAADLLAGHRYQLTLEPIRGDRHLNVAFE
jgi:hypothetical protein